MSDGTEVGKLSPLYFNLRHFSHWSSNRLQRSNAKSTQYIQLETFAAFESVSYPALLCPAISCPAVSCPVIWSVIFTSNIFSSPVQAYCFKTLSDWVGSWVKSPDPVPSLADTVVELNRYKCSHCNHAFHVCCLDVSFQSRDI